MAYVTCLVTKKFTFELPGKCEVLLVTGGLRKHRSRLDSTEMLSLTPGSGWREVSSARLPRPMSYFHVIALGDRILLFGECLHDSFKNVNLMIS